MFPGHMISPAAACRQTARELDSGPYIHPCVLYVAPQLDEDMGLDIFLLSCGPPLSENQGRRGRLLLVHPSVAADIFVMLDDDRTNGRVDGLWHPIYWEPLSLLPHCSPPCGEVRLRFLSDLLHGQSLGSSVLSQINPEADAKRTLSLVPGDDNAMKVPNKEKLAMCSLRTYFMHLSLS